MMRNPLLLLLLVPTWSWSQCDVAITDVNLETYEVTVEVINSEGCLPAPIGGVSGAVTMLQIGYHLPEAIDPDNEVVDLLTLPNAPCSPQWVDNGYTLGMVSTGNLPGWWYSPPVSNTFDADLMGANGLTTGDVVVIPLNPPGDYVTFPYPLAECGDDLIDYWLSEGECIEFVVWQLNYGSSWYTANGGWAETVNGYVPNPSTYQDQNCNNSWYMCRDENPGAPVANPDVCDVYPLDIQLDSVWVTDAACDIYNIGSCDAGLEWAFSYTNLGEEPISSWYFEITGPNSYYTTTTDLYGISANPPYDTTLLPGESNTIISTNGNAWVGGTELCVNAVIYDTDEPELSNNAFCITLPPLPDCCTDPQECEPDTIVVTETVYVELPADTVYQTLTLYDTTFVYDTAYVELPSDTVTVLEVDTVYVELPADTVYFTQIDTLVITDTIPVEVNWYFYDTTYIYVTDTLIEYVQLPADTVVVEQVDTVVFVEFVYLTDTLFLDCDTGEPCIEVLSPECIGSDLFIPNSFSPNNDGLNDAWRIVYDPQCWENVTFTIFNRWGTTIYWGSGDVLEWDGSVNGGSHYVADGTYVYTCTAKSVDSAEIVQESGYITVFR